MVIFHSYVSTINRTYAYVKILSPVGPAGWWDRWHFQGLYKVYVRPTESPAKGKSFIRDSISFHWLLHKNSQEMVFDIQKNAVTGSKYGFWYSNHQPDYYDPQYIKGTWWLIPLSKWVVTPVISGLTLLIPFITGVITHLRAVGWATK